MDNGKKKSRVNRPKAKLDNDANQKKKLRRNRKINGNIFYTRKKRTVIKIIVCSTYHWFAKKKNPRE